MPLPRHWGNNRHSPASRWTHKGNQATNPASPATNREINPVNRVRNPAKSLDSKAKMAQRKTTRRAKGIAKVPDR